MFKDFLLPPGCILRPAVASDRWSIRRLLHSFEREQPSGTAWVTEAIGCAGSGLLLAIGGHWGMKLGVMAIGTTLTLGLLLLIILVMLVGLSLWTLSDWQQFWVIEFQGQLIACAKLCCHRQYSALFNVLVAAHWRSQGVGSYLVGYLAATSPKPLYLACTLNNIEFYARFGFVTISPRQLSWLVRHDLELSDRADVVPLVLLGERMQEEG